MNDWLEKHRTLVLALVGVLVATGLVAVALRIQPAAPIVVEAPPPTPTPAPTATPGPIRVYVSGAVRQPDGVTLPPGALVRDALEAAGGPTSDADLDRINLAHTLADGEHIRVPAVGDEPTPIPTAAASASSGGGEPAALTGPVNINTATAAELEALPGIGPALAQRIVEYREANGPFTAIEQIQNVSGIGPAKFEAMKELIVVE